MRTFWRICNQFHHSKHCGCMVFHLDHEKILVSMKGGQVLVKLPRGLFTFLGSTVVWFVMCWDAELYRVLCNLILYEPLVQKRMFSMSSSVSLLQMSVNVRVNKSSYCESSTFKTAFLCAICFWMCSIHWSIICGHEARPARPLRHRTSTKRSTCGHPADESWR